MSLQKPVLLIGAGALGSSLLKGLRIAGNATPSEVMILDLKPGDEANAWAAD